MCPPSAAAPLSTSRRPAWPSVRAAARSRPPRPPAPGTGGRRSGRVCHGACGSMLERALQQRRARPVAAISSCGRLPVARGELAAEQALLAVDHHARAHLVDVRALADQPRVLHHLRLAPARLQHHLHAGAVACLQRAGGQQREPRPRRRGTARRRRRAACRRCRCRRSAAPSGGGAQRRERRALHDRRAATASASRRPSRRSRSHTVASTVSAIGRSAVERLVVVAPLARCPPARSRPRPRRRARRAASRSRPRSRWRTGSARAPRAGRPPRRPAAGAGRPGPG